MISLTVMSAFAVFGAFYMVYAREAGLNLWREYRFDENGNPLQSLFIPATTLFCKWLGGDAGQFTTVAFYFLAFLVCTVPFSWSLLSEKISGYEKQIVIRTGRGNYYFSKYVASFCSGAVVVAAPLMLNFVLSACFVPAFQPQSYSELYYGIPSTYLWADLFLTMPLLYVFLYIALAGIMAGLWATVGVSLSFILRNKVAVMICPYLMLLFLHLFWNSFAGAIFNIYVQMSPIYFIIPRELTFSNNGFIICGWIITILFLDFAVLKRKGFDADVL